MPTPPTDIANIYGILGAGELSRLDNHPVELLVTLRTISEALPLAPQRIADVGGGPGKYAFALADQGHLVDLVDLSPGLIQLAQVEQDKHPTILQLGIYDAVLLLGPLCHLVDESERVEAVANAARLAKPNGVLFVAFVSIAAHLRDIAMREPERLIADKEFYAKYSIMAGYQISTPIDCEKALDTSNLKGKTAIVTGGANGIGEAYVKALSAVGVNVCIGDMDFDRGSKLASSLASAKFVKCDVSKWDDQVRLFAEATSFAGKVDYVAANAGICPEDQVFSFAGKSQEPTEPNLNAIDVNLKGTLYTTKLAMHYFIKQNGEKPSSQQQDTCLVLIGSGAAFLDCLGGPVYPSTKWGVRGIMHTLRRTAFYHGTRVNLISPWYVKTSILSAEAFAHVESCGVQFAEAHDAGSALLRLLSDTTINGRSLFVSARKWAPAGYLDLDVDDYPGNELIQEIQEAQMAAAPVDKGLFVR